MAQRQGSACELGDAVRLAILIHLAIRSQAAKTRSGEWAGGRGSGGATDRVGGRQHEWAA